MTYIQIWLSHVLGRVDRYPSASFGEVMAISKFETL